MQLSPQDILYEFSGSYPGELDGKCNQNDRIHTAGSDEIQFFIQGSQQEKGSPFRVYDLLWVGIKGNDH